MDLARKLAKYLYVADLLPRRRVLELNAGTGASARFLLSRGAREVIACEAEQELVSEGLQAGVPRGVKLLQADYRTLPLADGSVDLVVVGDGDEVVRDGAVLAEIRRVLSDEGGVLLGVTARTTPRLGEGRAARGGHSYDECLRTVESYFGATRMVGMAPFSGVQLIDYEAGEDPEIVLDSSLVGGQQEGAAQGGEIQAIEYVALAGLFAADVGAVAVVELPHREPPSVSVSQERVAAERISGGAANRVELARLETTLDETRQRLAASEGRYVDAARRCEELAAAVDRLTQEASQAKLSDVAFEAQRGEAVSLSNELARVRGELESEKRARQELLRGAGEHQKVAEALGRELSEQSEYAASLERQLRTAEERALLAEQSVRKAQSEGEKSRSEKASLRTKVAELEGRILQLQLGGAEQLSSGAENARIAELEKELAKAQLRWKTAEEKNDELWRKVGQAERESAETRENAVRRASEQKSAHALALTRAMEEGAKRLASAQDETLRERKENGALRAEIAALKAKVAEALAQGEGDSEASARAAALDQTLIQREAMIAALSVRSEAAEKRADEAELRAEAAEAVAFALRPMQQPQATPSAPSLRRGTSLVEFEAPASLSDDPPMTDALSGEAIAVAARSAPRIAPLIVREIVTADDPRWEAERAAANQPESSLAHQSADQSSTHSGDETLVVGSDGVAEPLVADWPTTELPVFAMGLESTEPADKASLSGRAAAGVAAGGEEWAEPAEWTPTDTVSSPDADDSDSSERALDEALLEAALASAAAHKGVGERS